MRVLMVVRLFSGLADSLERRDWQPTGVPAIARLLEAVGAHEELEAHMVFTANDRDAGRRFPKRQRFDLAPLGSVEILPYRSLPGGPHRAERWLMTLEHTLRCFWLRLRMRPAVSFFTNSNFMIAGLFARLGRGRVVLRLMGIFPHHRRLAKDGGGPLLWLQRWLLASPFDHVICTQEGSGAENVLRKLLRPDVPLSVILNGVDKSRPAPKRVAELRRSLGLGARPVVLFVGRLESYKGCREFVEAVIEVLRRNRDSLDALVVGYGEYESRLRATVADAGLDDRIRVVGTVPHSDVGNWYALADIYVSLNLNGNLSNANLEALQAGLCMVLPEADRTTGIDEDTEKLIPLDAAPRVRRDRLAQSLAQILSELLEDPGQIEDYRRRTAAIAKDLLTTWSERTDIDCGILLGRQSGQPASR